MIRRLTLVMPVLAIAFSFAPTAAAQNGPYYAKPSWDQTLLCAVGNCPRYVEVLGGAGVLDRETGLVWETTPDIGSTSSFHTKTWQQAMDACPQRTTGGRTGWRLPTLQELGSVMDNGILPIGAPFNFVSTDGFVVEFGVWSATQGFRANTAWLSGNMNFGPALFDQGTGSFSCCVRGGNGAATQ